MQAFYEGLDDQVRQIVDASCGGAFMMKSEDEAYDLFEIFSKNSINHASRSSYERTMGPSKQAGLYEVKNLGETNFKMDLNSITQKLEKVDLLAQKVDQILVLSQQTHTNQPSSSPSPHSSS